MARRPFPLMKGMAMTADEYKRVLHALAAEFLAGPVAEALRGSEDNDVWATVELPDGKLLTVSVLNIAKITQAKGMPLTAEPNGTVPCDPGGDSPRGRPAEVGRQVIAYLRKHPNSPRAEIAAALEKLGFSASAVTDNLRVLRQLGYIVQPQAGGPYSVGTLE